MPRVHRRYDGGVDRPPTNPLHLGTFRLDRPIAAGGMGQVWSGWHGDTPVAVKVLTGGAAWDPSFRSLFRNEVRAAARLTHPGIIEVLDHGEIPAAAAAASGDALVAGSPYLVMEYASGGRLRRTGMHWARLAPLLAHLLRALGHAHARGVVHRDLKPSNILMAGGSDLRSGAKISDFGIAWVGDQPVDAAFAGTAEFMAPEQHAGDWPAYGPWTDLYALGIVAWWLASGRTPFHGYAGRAVARAHMFLPPPPLAARFPLPEGFETWLRALLHKDPTARFQTAADALAGLQELPELDGPAPRRGSDDAPDSELDVPTLVGVSSSAAPSSSSSSGLGDRIHTDEAPVGPAPDEHPPSARSRLPTDWRAKRMQVPLALRGAGLGLFELRDPAFVGRVTQRDHLWRALRASDRTGRPRVVWIQGAVGTGKTRLATWALKRAHAVAGVHGVYLPDDDVDRAFARHLGVDQLDAHDRGDAVHERLKRCPHRALPAALVEAMDAQRSLDRAQRMGAYRTLLEWHSTHRPALLIVDDAHDADDALALAEQIVRAPRRGRRAVVVVMVTRDDALATQSDQRARIEALVGDARSSKRIALGPLAPEERAQLLTGMGLSGPLAARVDARSDGNPMYIVQLVGDWVQSDKLRLGPDGFVLEGPEPPAPASLAAVWRERVEQLLASHPPAAASWLERAAVWGMAIRDDDWVALCELGEEDERLADLLVAQLLDARLAEETSGGWRFAHALVREGLLARASDHGHRVAHHRAAARVLLRQEPRNATRLGHHLLASGRAAEAVDPLLAGFDNELTRHGLRAAQQAYLPCEQAMTEALDDDDPRWALLWRHRSALLLRQGDRQEAVELARKACAHAEGRDFDLWCRGQLALAAALQARGDLKDALHELKSAVTRRLHERRRDLLLARLLERMGAAARSLGQLSDADQWSTQALGLLYRNDAPSDRIGAVLMEQALNAARGGDPERALRLFDEAEQAYADRGTRVAHAHLHNNRADTLAKLGRHDEAIAAFAEAAADLSALGADPVIPALNLALAHLRQSRPDEAAAVLDEQLAANEARSRHFAALVEVARAAAAAQQGDLPTVRRLLRPAGIVLQEAGFVDPDLLALYQLAAEALDETAEAWTAWGLVHDQAKALGDDDAAEQAARRRQQA